MKKQRQELSIHDFIGIFLPKLWIIVSVAVIFGIATFFYSVAFKSDTYTAQTEWYVYKNNTQTVTGSDIDVAQRILPNYKHTLLSEEFLKAVSESEKLRDSDVASNLSTSALRGMISFSTPTDTKYFVISVTSTSSELSYQVAQVIEELFPDHIRSKQPDYLSMALGNPARPNTTPNDKGTVRNTIISALIGLLISSVVVWLVWLFDFVVHDKKKLEARFDIPVLGVIPRQMLSTNKNYGGSVGRDG